MDLVTSLREVAEAYRILRENERTSYLLAAAADELERLNAVLTALATPTPRERIARAIDPQAFSKDAAAARSIADSVLAALETPTPEMLEAGARVWDEAAVMSIRNDQVEHVFRAMIREATK